MKHTNIDLHCDLLTYLLLPHTGATDEIGCSIPYLLEGNVGLQIMAIWSATGEGSSEFGARQVDFFKGLPSNPSVYFFTPQHLSKLQPGKLGVIVSIENASSFCEEDEKLESGFRKLETIIRETGNVFYIGMTHHTENRFGGGNNTQVGLKADGKSLIDFISDKNIAIDLAHTSDQLAYGILNYIDQRNYKVPVLASHSNSRTVFSNPRNLPDELIKELVHRKGLIGLNFIKDYVNLTKPQELYSHIDYLLKAGATENLAYGADFFFEKAHPDKSRFPFFFEEYNNALAYNKINQQLEKDYGQAITENISHKNALNFLKRLWKHQ